MSVGVEPVWINVRTKVAHRDPGCTRIIAWHATVRPHPFRPNGYRRCFYCYSAAGRRRYPGA